MDTVKINCRVIKTKNEQSCEFDVYNGYILKIYEPGRLGFVYCLVVNSNDGSIELVNIKNIFILEEEK